MYKWHMVTSSLSPAGLLTASLLQAGLLTASLLTASLLPAGLPTGADSDSAFEHSPCQCSHQKDLLLL